MLGACNSYCSQRGYSLVDKTDHCIVIYYTLMVMDMGYYEESLGRWQVLNVSGNFSQKKKMSKIGTEALVTVLVIRRFGYKQEKSDFNCLRIL